LNLELDHKEVVLQTKLKEVPWSNHRDKMYFPLKAHMYVVGGTAFFFSTFFPPYIFGWWNSMIFFYTVGWWNIISLLSILKYQHKSVE
jgi:hypothetical protein